MVRSLVFAGAVLLLANNVLCGVTSDPLRWGFIGCGRITNDFATAVDSLPRNEQQIVAFASRNASAGAEYTKRFNASKQAYASYEDLAKDPDIDVVDVGTINPTHYEIVHMLLDNNKNILCEKPLTLMKKHADELIEKAQRKKLFFQEHRVASRLFVGKSKTKFSWKSGDGASSAIAAACGVESVLPGHQRVREELPSLGTIRTTTVDKGQISGFQGQRLSRRELGGGALKDIGQYAIQFAVMANGNEMPEKIVGAAQLNNESIDHTTSILLQWKDGKIAQLSVSVVATMPNEAFVFGSNGTIKVPNSFMSPKHFEITHYSMEDKGDNHTKETYPFPKVDHGLRYGPNGAGMVYQANEVRNCLQKGLLESPLMTHKDTQIIHAIADEVLKQIGVSYENLYRDGKYVGSALHPEHDPT